MAATSPIKDENGRIVGAINCFHDTTERHLATETLEDLFQNANVAIHLASADGTILRANTKELQMLGYAPDEFVGRNIAEFHVDQTTIADALVPQRTAYPAPGTLAREEWGNPAYPRQLQRALLRRKIRQHPLLPD